MTNPCTCGLEYDRTRPECPFCGASNYEVDFKLTPPKPTPSQISFDVSSFGVDDDATGFKSSDSGLPETKLVDQVDQGLLGSGGK